MRCGVMIEFQAGKGTNMDCVMVRRILRKHGYPPEKQEKVTYTVLEQAELMAEGLVA